MTTSDKSSCRMLVAALVSYGVKHVVVSPGSRNTPLIITVARHNSLTVLPVVDERSAAFVALGIARTSGSPVALICTSGSAMLNYGPALAEALYSHVPLIAVTADRPRQWIDQADSQTIRQPGALPAVVKGSYTINGESSDEEALWYAERTLNEALTLALLPCAGPVHINIELAKPLGGISNHPDHTFRKIEIQRIEGGLHNAQARRTAHELASRKVLVICGFSSPSHTVSKAMATLASLPNVVVMAEHIANIKGCGVIENFEALLPSTGSPQWDELNPEIIIVCGGALVSARLKSYLRHCTPQEEWRVDEEPNIIDTFGHLTRHISMGAGDFFPKVANALAHLTRTGHNTGSYAQVWQSHIASLPIPQDIKGEWNATAAINRIISFLPHHWNLQLSNGLSVREVMQMSTRKFHRVDSNRGVSGIEGSTSTALGASLVYNRPTLLITGDMSMQYDLPALTSTLISPRLKIVVINNGGGGIFAYVASAASLPERQRFMQCELRLPLKELCSTYKLKYFCVTGYDSLDRALPAFVAEKEHASLMEVITDPDTDARALKTIQNISKQL